MTNQKIQIEELEMNETPMEGTLSKEQVNAKLQRLEDIIVTILEDIKAIKPVSAKKPPELVDNSAQTVDGMSPHRRRSSVQTEISPRRGRRGERENSASDYWPPIGKNMNYLNVFAEKALEREDKRKERIAAFKRRMKKLTASGTISSFIWFVCGMIVIYQGIKCVNKYNDSPKGAEIKLVDGVNELFPQFTICGAGKRYNITPDCGTQWYVPFHHRK